MAVETLHCEICDEDFDRERTRGRKPKQCDKCKKLLVTTKEPQEKVEEPLWVDTTTESALDRSYVNISRSEVPLVDGYGNAHHKSMVIGDRVVRSGDLVRVDGLDGKFKFRYLLDQKKSGKLAVEVIGVSAPSTVSKYYSVNPGRIK